MSAAFGVTTLINSFKILNDETASTGEKLASVFTGLTMGLPMAISGAKSLFGAYQSLKAIVIAYKDGTMAANAIEAAGISIKQ
jgi:hypothetical protein